MEKQIEEMAKAVCHLDRTCDECMTSFECKAMMYAKRFYEAGYRKISDDHQRQCTCYALGCQMAEELKKKVAREIFEQIDDTMELICAMTGVDVILFGRYAELKKKYTESEDTE